MVIYAGDFAAAKYAFVQLRAGPRSTRAATTAAVLSYRISSFPIGSVSHLAAHAATSDFIYDADWWQQI